MCFIFYGNTQDNGSKMCDEVGSYSIYYTPWSLTPWRACASADRRVARDARRASWIRCRSLLRALARVGSAAAFQQLLHGGVCAGPPRNLILYSPIWPLTFLAQNYIRLEPGPFRHNL